MEIFRSFALATTLTLGPSCALTHPAAGTRDATVDRNFHPDTTLDTQKLMDVPPQDAEDIFVMMDGGEETDIPGEVTPTDTTADSAADASADAMDASRVTTRPGTPHFLLNFDEAAGSILSVSPPRNFGELIGGASRTAENRFGSTGHGVSFQNPGDSVTATDSNFGNFGTGNFGLGVWIRLRSSFSSTRTIFSKRSVFAIRIGSTGNILFGSNDCTFNSAITISDTAWHHIAIIRHSGMMTTVVDGIPASSNLPCMGNFTGTNNLYIGCSETSGSSPCNLPLVGDLDQAYAWTGTDTTLEGVQRLICLDEREAGVAPSSFCP